MRWLPCIRRDRDRWWLPLSYQSSDVLAAALLASPGDPHPKIAVADQMRIDPPLLIYAALATAVTDEPPRSQLTLEQLAASFTAQLAELLTSGEAQLGAPAPPGGPADFKATTAQWVKLRKRFLKLPLSQWLGSAHKWLQLAGPPVPAAWRAQWPTLADDTSVRRSGRPGKVSYAPGHLDLTSLARSIRLRQVLERSFSDSVQAAKLAALKQFAYGLSHEINNPLANISTRAQTLSRGESDASRAASLQRIVDQAMRAHEMVADLMFYAHPPQLQPSSIDLHAVLRAVVQQSLQAVQGRCIELIVSASSEHVTAVADALMMTEAVRALVRNAIEAVGCDGKIQLCCRHDEASGENRPTPSLAAVASPRPIALITISDSGPGLGDAARVHAFDPYFSGREAGRGLGVGLCRVERIAQLHGGGVSLHSGPAGCTARLWIPLVS